VVVSRIEGKQHITLRCPAFDQANETHLQNLSLILRLAVTTLGIENKNLHLVTDKDLGTEVLIPQSLQKIVDMICISAQSPKGLYSGETYSFKSGFKANLIGLLAAMRLLTVRQEYVRKRPGSSPREPVVHTTYQDLQEMFNIRSGLKTDKPNYAQNVIKQILGQVVKPSNLVFPGGWIYSVREQNQ